MCPRKETKPKNNLLFSAVYWSFLSSALCRFCGLKRINLGLVAWAPGRVCGLCVWCVTWSWWCSLRSLSYSWARPLACLLIASTSASDFRAATHANSPHQSSLYDVFHTTSWPSALLIACSANIVSLTHLNEVPHLPLQPSVDLPAFQPPASAAVLLPTWIFPFPGKTEHKGFSLITALKLIIWTADDAE